MQSRKCTVSIEYLYHRLMEGKEQMADIIIITALAIVVFFIVRSQLRKLRRGQCGGGCAGCGGNCSSCCGTQINKAEN